MDVVGYSIASGLKSETIDFHRTDIPDHPLGEIYGCGSIIIGDELFVFGGFTTSAQGKNYKYNFKTKIWTQLASSSSIFSAYCSVIGNQIFIFGRQPSSLTSLKYDIQTNTFTSIANQPVSAPHDEITAVGESSADLNCIWCTSMNGKLFKYNTVTNVWTTALTISGVGYFDKSSQYCWIIDGNVLTRVNLINNSIVTKTLSYPVALSPGFAKYEGQHNIYAVGGNIAGDSYSSSVIIVNTTTGSVEFKSSIRLGRLRHSVAFDHDDPKSFVVTGGNIRANSTITKTDSVEKVDLNYIPSINGLENLKSWLVQN